MWETINNNSALLVLAVALVAVAWLAWDYRRSKKALAAIAVVVLVLTAGYTQARQGSSDAASLAEFDAMLAGGSPAVVKVYSDSCVVCLASRPAVDGLERRLEGQAQVIRMNIDDEAGWEVARRYGALVTPTFVVLDVDGTEVFRSYGYPDVDELEAGALGAG